MRNRKHDIERYLRGELTPAEMHALEKEALNDPFLAEALEGIEEAGAGNFLHDLHHIKRSMRDHMRRTGRRRRKTIPIWGWTSAVAATLLLLVVAGFLMVNILREQPPKKTSIADAGNGKEQTLVDSVPAADANKDALALAEQRQPEDAALRRSERQRPPVAAPGIANGAARTEADARDESQGEITVAQIPAESEVTATERPVEEVPTPGGDAEEVEQIRDDTAKKLAESEPLTERSAARKEAAKRAAGVQPRELPATATPEPLTEVKGKVTDERGEALPGVNVTVEGTATGTVTGPDGQYQLSVPGKEATLVFNFIGFEAKKVEVDNQQELNVTLEEDIVALSETVVVGYSEAKKSDDASFRAAEPEGGKRGFRDYLVANVRYPEEAIRKKTEGRVTVRFTVMPTGELSDFEVVNGIGNGCDEELIRAIRQGPKWKPAMTGSQPVRDKVRVRYKFALPK